MAANTSRIYAIMMLSIIPFGFTALLASGANAAVGVDKQEVFYCPFDISSSLASDSSSLDITYTSSNTQNNSIAFHGGNACYVRVGFTRGETKSPKSSIIISQVEYNGNQNVNIETSVTLDTSYSPVSRATPSFSIHSYADLLTTFARRCGILPLNCLELTL